MGKTGRGASRAVLVVSVLLALTSCTGDEPDQVEPSTVVSTPTSVAAEPADRLSNRLVALTDIQGRPLYVVPEGQRRTHLDALASPPLFERVYTPVECAPETVVTSPPEGLDGVLGRSHLSEDKSRLRVGIYTAPEEEDLIEYFVGPDPAAPPECAEYTVTTNRISQHFSHTGIDTPPVTPQVRSNRYSLTQDEATTHHIDVAVVNGMVAASVTLSTVNPADQAMIDAVVNIAHQATR